MDTRRFSPRTPRAIGARHAFSGVPADLHPGDGDRPLAGGKGAEFETVDS